MYLFISIGLSIVLGFVLLMMGTLIGGVIMFGVVAGCLFRGLYLLNSIYHKLFCMTPQQDKVQQVYRDYLENQDNKPSL